MLNTNIVNIKFNLDRRVEILNLLSQLTNCVPIDKDRFDDIIINLNDNHNIYIYIKDNKVKAIFVESSVSPEAIKSIAEDSGAVIGGELFSDAMGEPGELESVNGDSYDLGTYSGMIKHNVNTIVEALK